ncbi:hypothetical protein LG325_09310 [Marinobacter nauticus]
MDITAIKGAYDGFKHTKEIFQTLLDAKIDAEAKEKVSAAMKTLMEAQDSLFNAQSVMFSLQEENQALKQKVGELQEWRIKMDSYELVEAPGKAVVYKFKGDPEHYACPSCMVEKRISILQSRSVVSGVFGCPHPDCKAEYQVNPYNNAWMT